MTTPQQPKEPLAVVVADERAEAVERASELVRAAGHRVVAQETDLGRVAAAIDREQADVAVVATTSDAVHALALIERVNDTAHCPVVLLLDAEDPPTIHEALERGLDAYAAPATPAALQSAIDLARHRFAELGALGRQVRALEAGGARRGLIERAKGVLMERHRVDEREAYEMLRRKARADRISVAEIAGAVLRARVTPPQIPGQQEERS
jgi:response regulator NasT